jgi:hypothetical protein
MVSFPIGFGIENLVNFLKEIKSKISTTKPPPKKQIPSFCPPNKQTQTLSRM